MYDIPYKITNGTLVKMEADWDSLSIVVVIAPTGNGRLDLQLPRELADVMFNIGEMSVVLNGDVVDYYESTTCDHRTISVNFGKDASQVELIGGYIYFPNEPKLEARLKVEAEGKSTAVVTVSNSKICDWKLVKDEKKLEIMVQGGTWMTVTVHNRLLGGPYTVLVDGKKTEFSTAAPYERHSALSISYKNAKTIDIIGTTVIPEFPISVVVAASAAMLAATLIVRLRKILLNKQECASTSDLRDTEKEQDNGIRKAFRGICEIGKGRRC